MKTKGLLVIFFVALCQLAVYAQENSGIQITPLHKEINPATQERDVWNAVLKNETVEQFYYDEELEKIKEEKLKIKLKNLREGTYSYPQPKATNPIQPVLGKSFQGLSKGMQPHDNGTAVGNGGFLVHSINSAINFTDLEGNETYNNSLQGFFEVSGTPVDPRMVFDPYEKKWIALAIPTNFLGVYVAFSQTEDPNGKWNIYTVNVAGGGSGLYDYPHCGVTENELIVTGWATSSGCYCLQINKYDGFNGKDLRSKEYKVNGSVNTSVVNTGRANVKFGNKAYLLGSTGRGGTSVDLFTLTDTLGGNPQLEKSTVTVERYSPGGNALQKGGSSLDGIDCRIYSTIYTNGKVHFVTHSDYNQTGFNAVYYGIIDVQTKTSKTYFFNKPNTDLQFPSVASFTSGEDGETVSIFFLEVSSQTYPSSAAIVCDEQGNWSQPIVVKEGVGPISGGGSRTRWGDYTSSTRKHDASRSTVWVSGEYGSSSSRSSWNAEITIDDPTGITPEETAGKLPVNVFPNPVKFDLFYIDFDLPKDQNIHISMYGADGKHLATLFNDRAIGGENKLSFNKGALSPGIYFLRITGEDKKVLQHKKIVIN